MKIRWKGHGQRIAAIPVPATLFVLALGLFLMGAYIASPWNVPSTPVARTFHQEIAEVLFGCLYMLLGAMGWLGSLINSRRLTIISPYALMMGYTFLGLLRIIVAGWFPVTWLLLFMLAIIAGICRLALAHGPEVDRE